MSEVQSDLLDSNVLTMMCAGVRVPTGSNVLAGRGPARLRAG